MCSKFGFDIDYRCTLKNAEFLLLMSIMIFFFFFFFSLFLFNSLKAKIRFLGSITAKATEVKKQRKAVYYKHFFLFFLSSK